MADSGIRFKTSVGLGFDKISFENPFYNPYSKLILPQLLIDNVTKPIMALEMYSSGKVLSWVNCYVELLTSMLYTAEDVHLLRRAHALQHKLGTDENTLSFLHELKDWLKPNEYLLEDVKSKIKSHYASSWRTTLGRVCHHFLQYPLGVAGVVSGLVAYVISIWSESLTIWPQKVYIF